MKRALSSFSILFTPIILLILLTLLSLFILLFGFSEVLYGYNREVCFLIEWRVGHYTNAEAIQRRDNINFLSVNNYPVYFDTVFNSTVYSDYTYDHVISSDSAGCIDYSNFFVGRNTIGFQFVNGDGDGIIEAGYDITTVQIIRDGFSYYQLCRISLYPGMAGQGGCSRTIEMSYQEIDPAGYQALQTQKEDIKKGFENVQSDVDTIPELQEKVNKFNQGLEEASRKSIDDISYDEFVDLVGKDRAVFQLVKDASLAETSIKKLNQEISTAIKELTEELRGINHTATQALKAEGVDPSNENLFFYGIDEINIGDLALPKSEKSDSFEDKDSIYESQASQTIDRLQASIESNNRHAFVAIAKSWTENHLKLLPIIKARAAVFYGELRSYLKAANRVKKFIGKHIDAYGFFRDVVIPQDIKQSVALDIGDKKAYPDGAENLKQALNNWQSPKLTEQQKLIVQTIKVLGAAFCSLAAESIQSFEETSSSLRKVTDQTVTFVRLATYRTVDFTTGIVPGVNDARDYCEFATGIEFCILGGRKLSLLERAASGLGIVFGSGTFWREVGVALSGVFVPIGKKAVNLLDSAGDVGVTTKKGILLLGNRRINFLQAAENRRLRNAINQLYRRSAKIGDGGTADVIRYELRTGELLSKTGHTEKAITYRQNLQRILKQENLSDVDKDIARIILKDLQDALSGQ